MSDSTLGKRNMYTAAALLLLVSTWVPYVGESRIKWMMWRDAPVAAVCVAVVAIAFVVASLRLAREAQAHRST